MCGDGLPKTFCNWVAVRVYVRPRFHSAHMNLDEPFEGTAGTPTVVSGGGKYLYLNHTSKIGVMTIPLRHGRAANPSTLTTPYTRATSVLGSSVWSEYVSLKFLDNRL